MNPKLLDKDRVIEALETAHRNMWLPSMHNHENPDPVSEEIRILIHTESKRMVEEAFTSFVATFALQLESCEPDKYPCALCHEERNEKIT